MAHKDQPLKGIKRVYSSFGAKSKSNHNATKKHTDSDAAGGGCGGGFMQFKNLTG
jgi:hypothetical protein